MEFDYAPEHKTGRILCCECGAVIPSTGSALCSSCLKNSVDITAGIPKQLTLQFCRNCERYLDPPNKWIPAALESRDLLALCLRKMRGLAKLRLVDASFIWTEPHSKRVKLKVTVQQEV